jgi:hypothetical protein
MIKVVLVCSPLFSMTPLGKFILFFTFKILIILFSECPNVSFSKHLHICIICLHNKSVKNEMYIEHALFKWYEVFWGKPKNKTVQAQVRSGQYHTT